MTNHGFHIGRELDEGILPRISNIFYEDEMNFPSAPDVANYLSPEVNLEQPMFLLLFLLFL